MAVTLHICVSCRGWPSAPGPVPPGRRLAQAVLGQIIAADAPCLQLIPVTCMNACRYGCNAALTRSDGRVRIAGGLGPGDAAAVIAWAQGGPMPGRLIAEIPPGNDPMPETPSPD